VRLVSAERIGGGLAADGQGELSKLLLGPHPAKALRLARDTGVLTTVLPEFEVAIGHDTGAARQGMPVDEHTFETVQQGADLGVPLEVRLALLLHDLAKPIPDRTEPHAEAAARLAGPILRRLRYPARLVSDVVRIVRGHAFPVEQDFDGEAARRFLASHGDRIAALLIQHKRADLRAKTLEAWELPALDAMEQALERELQHPHRLADLAIDGNDLIALGVPQGPRIGVLLNELLDEVLTDPSRNTPERLRERAKELA
jgi:tRNA nucleotidyltransferase/poly(A) polymerase